MKEVNLHENHRDRMRKRFLSSPNSFSKHEIVELLLFYTIPRKNTNVIAHDLVERYGDIRNIINASPQELVETDGIGESAAVFLSLIGKVMETISDENIKAVSFHSLDKVTPHVLNVIGALSAEKLCVYYLNGKGSVIKSEYFTQLKPDSVHYEIEDIQKTCILVKAKRLIIAHNHPSGDLEPSYYDDKSTAKFISMAKAIGVEFDDHIIVGKDSVYSYKTSGRLEKIKREVEE